MTGILAAIDAAKVGIPKVSGGVGALQVVLGVVYALIGAVAVFYMARAALLFITSGSEPSSVKAARETILYAVIAMVASTMVFGILSFVVSNIGGS
jgi:hypothetical protein